MSTPVEELEVTKKVIKDCLHCGFLKLKNDNLEMLMLKQCFGFKQLQYSYKNNCLHCNCSLLKFKHPKPEMLMVKLCFGVKQ